MLGNDVVDLRDPESRLDSFRSRFRERVFDAVERRAIERDANPDARSWAHWAAKESAYKLARQLDAGFVFSPSKLGVRFQHETAHPDGSLERVGRIELAEPIAGGLGEVELRSSETPDRVHVVALPAGADWQAVVGAIERLGPQTDARPLDPSQAVRELAVRRVARDLGIECERVAIGRRGRIPTVEIDGESSAMAISLSHHGDWIACVMAHRPAPHGGVAATDGGDVAIERGAQRRTEGEAWQRA